MLPRNTHIIQKQSFEIGFENPENTLGLQDQIAQVFYEHLKPRMETLLDDMFSEDQYATIERLEIDLGTLNPENWEQEFTERALEKLKTSLATAQKDIIGTQKYRSQRAIELFFFYLENGFLPWNSRVTTIEELERQLKVDTDLISRLKELISQKDTVAVRLVLQFSENFIQRLIQEFSKNQLEKVQEISGLIRLHKLTQAQPDTHQEVRKNTIHIAMLQTLAHTQELTTGRFLNHLYSLVKEDNELEAEIRGIISSMQTGEKQDVSFASLREKDSLSNMVEKKSGSKVIETQTEDSGLIRNNPPEKTGEDVIYIENAGLVLLHPFLMSLFENLGLAEHEKWQNDFCQQKAVMILEYLAKGIAAAEEHELVLNKIMCGLQPEEVINTKIQLEAGTLTECESLLTAVIENWSILRNTSVESLRETFLMRPGKLSKVDQGWLLQVEQRSFDVLLSHLPWGIGIIKMPVMSEMLFVEWT